MAMDEVVPGDRSLALEAVPEVRLSTAGGAATATSVRVVATEGPSPSSGLVAGTPSSPPRAVVNDNTVEEFTREPKVILGHRFVRAPVDVSVSDATGTTHFALNQMQSVLHRERADLDEEWLCLSEYVSLLKEVTASEKAKAR
jgi:hypothetical protein